jgi:hypothetical protein
MAEYEAAQQATRQKTATVGVGCVVVNYQSVTVTSHTYEYC